MTTTKERWKFSHRFTSSRGCAYYVWLKVDAAGKPLNAWAMEVSNLLEGKP